MVHFKGEKLFNENKLIRSFNSEIESVVSLENDCIAVMLVTKSFTSSDDRNVICVDLKGEEKWKIVSEAYPDGPSAVTEIWYDNKVLKVFRFIGVEEVISIDTGEILSSVFTK